MTHPNAPTRIEVTSAFVIAPGQVAEKGDTLTVPYHKARELVYHQQARILEMGGEPAAVAVREPKVQTRDPKSGADTAAPPTKK